MQRKNLLIIAIAAAFASIAVIAYINFVPSVNTPQTLPDDEAMSFNLSARQQWELDRLKDPATGKIPDGIRKKELAFAATLPKADAFRKNGDIWENMGPWNVGGRTRAIAIDATNEDILLAGAATGGIWRSEDAGKTWTKTTTNTQTNAITSLAQDTRAGKTNIWYATTGERLGASASKTGAFFAGNGFLKSTDGGKSWKALASTAVNTPQFDVDYDLGWTILVNPAITDKDVVFAAIYGGIYRSANGGDTWQRVRGGRFGGNLSEYTDIAVTSTGILYATLDNIGPQKGIWRSDDNGDTWANITPADFPVIYERMVIGIVPQFENQVYILAHTPGSGQITKDFRGTEEGNSLWKYTYLSGDGTGSGGVWEDRSRSIPNSVGEFEPFNAQGGYDYFVRVHPKDTNIVIIGGSSLFRSGDGFKTQNKLQRIGGYALGTRRPDFQIYENHHPDQHNMVFYPSNPDKVISTHDGGISITTNVKQDIVQWQSLNNGYVTTQFYTVALNESKAGDNVIIGGLQDNGTLFTNKNDAKNPWSLIFSYDGAFCHVANNGNDYYVAKQQAGLYRINLDNNYKRAQSARLDPLGEFNYLFINPWCVNPNDDKQVYLLAGNIVLRCKDITQIPLDNYLDSSREKGYWDTLSTAPNNAAITAISMAENNSGTLFYGTSGGRVYRVKNAATANNPTPEDITGTMFPQGNIGNVCVHPDDENKLIVVMTNYSIRSIFYTEDGGQNWTDISGNLEQNANGSGNGPSCRWATFIKTGADYGVLVATSVGLYGTAALDSVNTIWVQQSPNGIGNAICEMIKIRRSDGRVVLATHGAGVYAANITRPYHLTGIEGTEKGISFKLYPNPATEKISIDLPANFEGITNYRIFDTQGKLLIDTKGQEKSINLPISALQAGTYLIRIENKKGQAAQFFIKQ